MNTPFPPGPYSLGGSEAVVIDGVEHKPAHIMRMNDGALAIMAPDTAEGAYDGERRRLGLVDLTVQTKRGQAWSLDADADPLQMATARLWMAAPDMVAALTDLLAEVERYAMAKNIGHEGSALLEAISDGRAALAKARGE